MVDNGIQRIVRPFPGNTGSAVVVVSGVMVGVSGNKVGTLFHSNFNDNAQKILFLPAGWADTEIPKEVPRLQVLPRFQLGHFENAQ
jgi:hypothetical protein